MKAIYQSGSEAKATTPARHLVATAMIGAALIGYQIHPTPEARIRLECLTTMAHCLGDLNASDAAVVAELLAKPLLPRSTTSVSLV
ncbi:MAG: hypothetical protein WBI95_24825 [Pseudomonas veronii]|uniref:hypothetical protein n=1 Tax=Pseudomonas veronii TaxID=76761 RepID=UPI003C774D4A